MAEGFVPGWIQPADEVGHLAQGYQVGMALGARQAEQAFREQQMMRQQQLDAQQKAQWEAEFGLQSAAAARKAAAVQAYQADIAKGVDPIQAIIKHGPSIGMQGGPEAAALRSMQMQNQKPPTWVPPNATTGAPGYLDTVKGPVFPKSPSAGPASIQLVDEAMKANQAALTAEQSGDPNAKTLRDRANLLLEQTKKPNLALGWDDQGRLQSLSFGTGATPTVATASRAQQKLQKYENATEIIDRVQSGLQAGHVGLAGLGGEYLWDKGMVQLANMLGDETAQANPERVNSRAGIIMLRESLMRELGDNPTDRTAMAEREEIARALPSSGVFESLSDAKQKMATVRKIMSNRSVVYSNSIGKSAPVWALKDFTPQEIKDMMKAGKVDYKTAFQALKEYH